MTTIEHTTKTSDPGPALRCLAWAVPSAVAGTLAVWVVARLGGVDLVVGSGDDARTVGWVSVALVSALAAAAGSLLLALLGRLPAGPRLVDRRRHRRPAPVARRATGSRHGGRRRRARRDARRRLAGAGDHGLATVLKPRMGAEGGAR